MYTHTCPCTSLVFMPEEEGKGPGFSSSHMHLIPVHQRQGDNDAVRSHGQLCDVFTVELAWLI